MFSGIQQKKIWAETCEIEIRRTMKINKIKICGQRKVIKDQAIP